MSNLLRYLDRQEHYMFSRRGHNKKFCINCFNHVITNDYCQICNEKTYIKDMHSRVRIPKKNAKKNIWKQFFNLFFSKLDFEILWRHRQLILNTKKS